MGVDNYKTVPKLGVEEMIVEANKIAYMISNPIEHYIVDINNMVRDRRV